MGDSTGFAGRQWERVRSSLFFVPLVFAIGAGAVAEGLVQVDREIDGFPDRITSTVDSARALLTLVAGATLTFAGVAFSISLLLISAASSQYSPRVVHGLFRDPFNKRVMGVVVGTFVYCLVVIRAVRGRLEETGEPVVPSLAILAIVAFINHAAHSMEVSTMLDRVTREALGRLPPPQAAEIGEGALEEECEGEGFVVDFDDHGWIQAIDYERLAANIPPGSTIRLETGAGRYAILQTPICRIWPPPDDREAVTREVRQAVTVGPSRTLQQDETFGVRQLADVALKALSPGVNDPTTAQDAIFHMGSIVRELLDRSPASRVQELDGDKRLILTELPTAEEIVELAFDEVRLVSEGQATVLVYLLEILRLIRDSLEDGHHPEAVEVLTRQAALVAEVGERSDLPSADHDRVRSAFRSRFG